MDQARVQPSQRLIVEAEPREPADPEVLDQDVAALEQAVQDGDAIGLLEVEPDAALVAIDREVVGRGPGSPAPAAGPTHGGPQPRVASPSGGSTLTTSAPRSPSSIVQYGPARTVEQSTTRRPASGPGAGGLVIVDRW